MIVIGNPTARRAASRVNRIANAPTVKSKVERLPALKTMSS